jgi:hypothetical protein
MCHYRCIETESEERGNSIFLKEKRKRKGVRENEKRA